MDSNDKAKLIEARMNEMAAREAVLAQLRDLGLGLKATRLLCESELGYTAFETRAVLISLGLVLTSEAMTSPDPIVRVAIDRLREWRRVRSRREGQPAYRILTNRALMALAQDRPRNAETLKNIRGVGPKLTGVYGDEILAILNRA